MPSAYEKRRREEAAAALAHAQIARPKRRGLGKNRFTLRAIFAVTILCAAAFAWLGAHRRESLAQRAAAEALERGGFGVEYGLSHWPEPIRELAPQTLTAWFGRVEMIHSAGTREAPPQAELHRLHDLRRLVLLYPDEKSIAGLSLDAFPRLEELMLAGPLSSDDVAPRRERLPIDLAPLRAMPRLHTVALCGHALDEAQLDAIGAVESLVELRLVEVTLSAAWTRRLTRTRRLAKLSLYDVPLTVADARELARQTSLASISVDNEEPLSVDVRNEFARLMPTLYISDVGERRTGVDDTDVAEREEE